MKRILFGGMMLCWALTAVAQQPEQVIEQMLAKLEATAMQADFVLGLQDDVLDDEPQIYRGSVLLKGNRFHLTMQGIEVFYNGMVQWAYAVNADELTITTPTPDDLAGTNPLFMLRRLLQQCHLDFDAKEQMPGCHTIAFYPNKEKSELRKLLLFVAKAGLMPQKLVLEASQGNITTLILSNLETDVAVTEKSFTADLKDYPDAFINDLR